ncbi:conserved hypothetical protein [Candidatus Brocadia pituitae]|nr:hypothetical protein [Candidatus Brocadia sp.]BBO17958.1 conserved hypothetical protein [Candidatus Brocadia pituitae]
MSTVVIKDSLDETKKKEVHDIEKKRLFNAYKYCGILKWKLKPINYQKELRNEWKHPD